MKFLLKLFRTQFRLLHQPKLNLETSFPLGDPIAFYFELDIQDVIIWILKLIEAFSLEKTARLIDDLAEVFFPDKFEKQKEK